MAPPHGQHATPRLNLPAWRDTLWQAGWWASAALVAALALGLWLAWRTLQPTPEKRLVIATGPERGAYEAFAQRYRPLLQAHGVQVVLRPTQGSGENLALLNDPAAGVSAAFVQAGVPAAAPAGANTEAAAGDDDDDGSAGRPGLRSLGHVALEPLWVFHRLAPERRPPAALAGSGAAARAATAAVADGLATLRGHPIDVGPAGSGTGALVQQLADAAGLPPGQLKHNTSTLQAVVDLVQGRSMALALVAAADAPLVQYLLNTPGVALLDFPQAEAYARRFPFLQAVTLPRGLVDLAADKPARDLHLLATTATLLVHQDLHPALQQLLLQSAHAAHRGAGWFHRPGHFPHAQAGDWPLSAEAERYFRQGPPWLQRYLPFWLANFMDRMWIVLLPLLAALLPLSRVLPPLVAHRLRSRVFRWYANLRALEQRLDQPAPPLALLREELERLDAQTERIGVPLSYAGELYDLRSHIQLVRRRLSALEAQRNAG
jgi:TRAP-type uncharacterized transport system substrate-binding protein